MKSLIIVESHNDKYFIEKLRDILDLENIELKEPVCKMADYECLNGLSEKKLQLTLNDIKFDEYQKIGIIIDADNEGIQKRIDLINSCIRTLEEVPEDFQITKINEFIRVKNLDIEIGCYITNKDGFGELETVLKAIKKEDSTYADCLDSWKTCLNSKGKEINDKDFDKFWVSNYLRFDTCTKKEQKQADKNCKNEVAIRKNIWDFENPILEYLKEFLKLLNS